MVGYELKLNFHRNDLTFIVDKSWFRFSEERVMPQTIQKSELSSANNFGLDINVSGRSFIKVRKSNGPGLETCGAPASTLLPFKKSVRIKGGACLSPGAY